MRRQLGETVTPVLVYYIWSVERQLLVRIDADHQAGDSALQYTQFSLSFSLSLSRPEKKKFIAF